MKKAEYQDVLSETRDRVYTYLYYLLKNREDAEDITQEVYIRLWNHWDRVEKPRVHGWLMRVAHNRAIDLIRQNRTANTQEKRVKPLEYFENYLASEGTPESVLESNEKKKCITAALDTLPPKTKSILILHYFQGMKYKEIGASLNMNLSAVKVSVHRGKKMLRDALMAQGSEVMHGVGYGNEL